MSLHIRDHAHMAARTARVLPPAYGHVLALAPPDTRTLADTSAQAGARVSGTARMDASPGTSALGDVSGGVRCAVAHTARLRSHLETHALRASESAHTHTDEQE